MFALSCHPDEMDGIESPGLRAQIANEDASIPALTETLPEAVLALLQQRKSSEIQTVHLTLKVQAESAAIRACAAIRRMIGRAWGSWSNAFPQPGFRAMAGASKPIVTSALKPQRCLLNEAFFGLDFHHDDFFEASIDTENNPALANAGAHHLDLENEVFRGFLLHWFAFFILMSRLQFPFCARCQHNDEPLISAQMGSVYQ